MSLIYVCVDVDVFVVDGNVVVAVAMAVVVADVLNAVDAVHQIVVVVAVVIENRHLSGDWDSVKHSMADYLQLNFE